MVDPDPLYNVLDFIQAYNVSYYITMILSCY